MPHRSATRWAARQISGLARLVRANALASFENIALWHERDITRPWSG
jgi:adenylosuccinate lyase